MNVLNIVDSLEKTLKEGLLLDKWVRVLERINTVFGFMWIIAAILLFKNGYLLNAVFTALIAIVFKLYDIHYSIKYQNHKPKS
ncbi:hypothetical protein [Bacillus sp. JJ722]|uniref:hypothetical protein n=1 Tax=Bacillus sp. JJ722 TaxID=3122973 RepID=UPI002FFD5D0D